MPETHRDFALRDERRPGGLLVHLRHELIEDFQPNEVVRLRGLLQKVHDLRHDRVVRNEPAQGKGKRTSYASATDAAHADWLGKAVTANPQLANLTDSIGRRAIDIAHPACKQAMQAALEARAPSDPTAGTSNEMETLRAELKAAREEAMAAGAAREKAEASAACCTPYSTRTPARPVFHMPVMVLCVMLSGSFPPFSGPYAVAIIRSRRSYKLSYTRKRHRQPLAAARYSE